MIIIVVGIAYSVNGNTGFLSLFNQAKHPVFITHNNGSIYRVAYCVPSTVNTLHRNLLGLLLSFFVDMTANAQRLGNQPKVISCKNPCSWAYVLNSYYFYYPTIMKKLASMEHYIPGTLLSI